MAHYRSITEKIGGSWYNMRSVVRGKQLTPDQAVEHAIKTKSLGKPYPTMEEAVWWAKVKSKTQNVPIARAAAKRKSKKK